MRPFAAGSWCRVLAAILALSGACCASAQQGAVTFANSASTPIQVRGTNIHATVALYGSTSLSPQIPDSTVVQLGATASTFAPGLFVGGTRYIGNPGDVVLLQVRAWTGGYASYDEALAAALSIPGVYAVKSPAWEQPVGGGLNPTQPITGAGRFAGLNIEPLDVPEPSAIALTLLGLATAFVCYRRS